MVFLHGDSERELEHVLRYPQGLDEAQTYTDVLADQTRLSSLTK